MHITLNINGAQHNLDIPAERTLLDALRDDLGLGGAREGCGIGMCGACTVLVEGRAISGCLILAAQAEGHDVTTIEGLADGDSLHPVQQAYIDHAGFQCAYCTPGFVLSTVALGTEHPDADAAQIKAYLSGNLCRCGSYVNILAAVQAYLAGRQ